MKKLLLALALFAGLTSQALAQGYKPINQWPVPPSGSPYISNGDIGVFNRNNITYQMRAGWGGTCAANQWVNFLSPQGVPSCAQPYFSNIGGFLALSQIGGLVTNGQIPIGSTGTGAFAANTLTAGAGVTIANGPGTITISAGSIGSGVVLGTSAPTPNPISSNGAAGLVGIGTSVGIEISGTENYRFNSTGLGIGTTAPQNLLEIGGGLLGALPGNKGVISNGSGNSGWDIGQASGYRGHFSWLYNATPANAYMTLGGSNGTTALDLQDLGGNVGVGTSVPGALFTVGNNAFEVNSSGNVKIYDAVFGFVSGSFNFPTF